MIGMLILVVRSRPEATRNVDPQTEVHGFTRVFEVVGSLLGDLSIECLVPKLGRAIRGSRCRLLLGGLACRLEYTVEGSQLVLSNHLSQSCLEVLELVGELLRQRLDRLRGGDYLRLQNIQQISLVRMIDLRLNLLPESPMNEAAELFDPRA